MVEINTNNLQAKAMVLLNLEAVEPSRWSESERHYLFDLVRAISVGALTEDVRALVIAAREFWDENSDEASLTSNELLAAMEAFAGRVPFADEPGDL